MGAYVTLALSLVVLSFAAVVMRLAQINGIPSNVIAATRLSLAALIITPFVLSRHRDALRRLTRSDIMWSCISGAWIGVHFLLMTISLEHTTILIAQVIVNTSPLWVALMETVFLKTRISGPLYIAIVLTMVGGGLIALASASGAVLNGGGDFLLSSGSVGDILNSQYDGRDPVLGATLALLGAIAGSVYLTLGRKVRASVDIVPYVWIVFGVGGMVGMGAVFISGTPLLGYSQTGYLWLLVLTIGPHLVGHSSFNYTLRFFSATFVSIGAQSITVSAALVAFVLFAEVPGPLELTGSAIIMFGVILAIIGSRRRARRLAA
ncbi:MAG: DMT family transporter [Anaerolineaceae bacterium]|nr:MAG: DMT family transporter [Anaerolineaceae bacterium]